MNENKKVENFWDLPSFKVFLIIMFPIVLIFLSPVFLFFLVFAKTFLSPLYPVRLAHLIIPLPFFIFIFLLTFTRTKKHFNKIFLALIIYLLIIFFITRDLKFCISNYYKAPDSCIEEDVDYLCTFSIYAFLSLIPFYTDYFFKNIFLKAISKFLFLFFFLLVLAFAVALYASYFKIGWFG